MDQQEKQELMEEVIELKNQVVAFLKVHNLKPRGDSINILFSENLEKPLYKQLYEIEGEPEVVKVEFTLTNIKSKQPQEIQGILDLLINKIVRRDFPDTTGTPYEIRNDIIDTCTHYNSIEIKNNKVTLTGVICYCN